MSESTHRRLSRGVEDDALTAVAKSLVDEGCAVGLMRRPDREPELRRELRARPDGYADVDGVPTAFDVTQLTTEAEMRTFARVQEIKALASPLVEAIAPDELIAIILHFRVDDAALLAARSTKRHEIARRIASAVDRTLRTGQLRRGAPDVYLDDVDESFRITVGAPISPSTGVVMWASAPEGTISQTALGPWLASTIQKKMRQHEGWGRGVLIVVAAWTEDAVALAEGIADHVRDVGPMPWWRIYLCGFAHDSAQLIWPRASQPPRD